MGVVSLPPDIPTFRRRRDQFQCDRLRVGEASREQKMLCLVGLILFGFVCRRRVRRRKTGRRSASRNGTAPRGSLTARYSGRLTKPGRICTRTEAYLYQKHLRSVNCLVPETSEAKKDGALFRVRSGTARSGSLTERSAPTSQDSESDQVVEESQVFLVLIYQDGDIFLPEAYVISQLLGAGNNWGKEGWGVVSCPEWNGEKWLLDGKVCRPSG